VRFTDYDGNEQSLSANGLLARCIQHELDHLDGIIFVDRMSAVKRNIILRKLTKIKKQQLRESA
jgi:peptide deformylase